MKKVKDKIFFNKKLNFALILVLWLHLPTELLN